MVRKVDTDPKLYTKDISKITGLSEQLIQKWENRYQILNPKKLANGYQVYSQEDVVTLLELKKTLIHI